jgi:Domain of unknown function (DUF397)
MAMPDPPRADWRKSTRSNGGGECVEVAFTPDAIAIRDSKAPQNPVIAVAPTKWHALVRAIKSGHYDL